MNKEKNKSNDNCEKEDCKCGCKEGEPCTCNHENGECDCGEDCGCQKGEPCDCGEDCKCHEHDCECGQNCDCNHQPTLEDYQKAFDQFEAALIKVDGELKKAKEEASENQRIAVTYKKDLERYKERNKNIEIDSKNSAIENVAMQIIPVIDQFEQALKCTQDSSEKKGFEMIYSSLKRIVEGLGISEIDALGNPFDSNLHSAVNKVKVKKKDQDGIVTAVYQKGYKLKFNDKIIRYATVEVGEYIK